MAVYGIELDARNVTDSVREYVFYVFSRFQKNMIPPIISGTGEATDFKCGRYIPVNVRTKFEVRSFTRS